MDRRWMYDRCHDGGQVKEVFKLGVELFIDAVKQNPVVRKAGGIRCPCAVCQCRRIRSEDDIRYHLSNKGFQPNYWIWTSHGETFPSDQGASSNAGPHNLIYKVVYNSKLMPLPKTDAEPSTEQQDVAEEEDREDEEIRDVDLLDPEKYLLVDRHDRVIIMPHTSDLQPHKKATSAITYIIQTNYHDSWLNWGEIKTARIGDEPVCNTFWNAFKTKCTWLEVHDAQIRAIFDHKCTKRLSALLFQARKLFYANMPPPKWLGDADADLWKELKVKWSNPDYKNKCNRAKQNRSVQPDASFHSGGSTSSSTLRIRFEQKYHRAPTLDEMNKMLHLRPDGTWDSVRAEKANTMIKTYINKLKADQTALPPDQRKSGVVLHNMILDKFVEFSGGKQKGHILGQGSTSSFIQKTPAGYVDISCSSFNNSSNSSTARSARVESLAEIEQRLRDEQQESLETMRVEILAQLRAAFSGQQIPLENLSDQLQPQRQQQQIPLQNQSDQFQAQRQRHRQRQLLQQQMQQPQMQQRVNLRPPVPQNRAVGRNPQSSFYQPDQFHEDEYRPPSVATNYDEPDEAFFDNLVHDSKLQTMIREKDDLEIHGFTNRTHDAASWNQGGETPVLSSQINIQDNGTAYVNHSGGGGMTPFNSSNFQAGPNEFNVSGGRTSAGRTSAGRTSAKSASGRSPSGVKTSGRGARGRTSGGRGGNA